MFEHHGDVEIKVSGDIIRAVPKGYWNEEAADFLYNAYAQAIFPLVGRVWGSLVILDEWKLATPGFEPLMLKNTEHAINFGMAYEAFVAQELTSIQLAQMERAKPTDYDESQYQRVYFKTEREALAWFKENGLDCGEF